MSQTVTSEPILQWDRNYFNTIDGKLKICQLVLNMLGFICVTQFHYYYSHGLWFNFVAWAGFWITLILGVCHVFHLTQKFNRIPWLGFEKYYCAVWTVFYFIAAAFAITSGLNAIIVAGVFGFFAMIAYGYDAYMKHTAGTESAF